MKHRELGEGLLAAALHTDGILGASLLLIAAEAVTLSQIETRLKRRAARGIVLQELLKRSNGPGVLLRQIELLGGSEVHLLLLLVSAAQIERILLDVFEELVRAAHLVVYRLYGQHSLFALGGVGKGLDHLLVTVECLLIAGKVPQHHTLAYEGAGLHQRVGRAGIEAAEGLNGLLVAAHLHLGLAQLVESLGVHRTLGRSVLDV